MSECLGDIQRVAYIKQLLVSEGYDISKVQPGPENPSLVPRELLYRKSTVSEATWRIYKMLSDKSDQAKGAWL